MPTYDYTCSSCGETSEIVHSINSGPPSACPTCGAVGTLRKEFNPPTIHFKGSGWAKKDRSASHAKANRAAESSSSSNGPSGSDGSTSSSDSGSAGGSDSGSSGGSDGGGGASSGADTKDSGKAVGRDKDAAGEGGRKPVSKESAASPKSSKAGSTGAAGD
jgi:putative FmdB family regulatory protein